MKLFILFALFVCIYADSSSSEEESNPQAELLSKKEPLKKLVKLIEEHKMNVTLVASENKYYTNGNIKESAGFSIQYPKSQEVLKSSAITDDVMKNFVKLAKENGMTAMARSMKIVDGKVHLEAEFSNSDEPNHGMPRTNVYKWLTHVYDGHQGFDFNHTDRVVMKNFIITGADGKNETVTTIDANLEVQVKNKGAEMKDEEIAMLKKALPKVHLLFSTDDDLKAKGLGLYLKEKLPQFHWQIVVNPGDFYVDTKKFANLQVANEEFLIFALKH